MKIGFISCFEHIILENFEQFGFDKANSLLDFDLLLWDIGFLHFGYHRKNRIRNLLKDRQRRLNELKIFLDSGKTLVILLSDINDLKQRMIEGDGEAKILIHEGFSPNEFDVFSFLPVGLERIIRESIVESRGKRIDFRGDPAFLPAWYSFFRVAWYDAYFTIPIGTPFLYVSGTQLPVGTWLPYSKGNIFFIPATEYDTNEDYPDFVKAAIKLQVALHSLEGSLIEVPWQHVNDEISPSDKEFESSKGNHNSSNLSSENLRQELRTKMIQLFNSSEIRDLCFDLGIIFEEVLISEGRFTDIIRELILLCEKKQMIRHLIEWCQNERPNENWAKFLQL